MAKRKYVWFAEVNRFGYFLQCIGNSESEVRDAIIEEYVRAYKTRNDGADPRAEYLLKQNGSDEYNAEDADYYEWFIEELYIEKRELGKVEWR